MTALWQRLHEAGQRLRLNSQRRTDFYELLGHFVHDGLPLFEALSEIDRQYRKAGEPMALVSSAVMRRMRGEAGRAHTFGSAVEGYVPVVEALAIASGEDAGNLADGLYRAARVCRNNGRIVATMRAELAYPAFLVLMFAALMIGVAEQVIPMLAAVMPVERWPTIARSMAAVAAATPWLLLVLGSLLGGVLVSFLLLRSEWTGRLRGVLDQRLFPWTLHRRITGSMLLSAVATLIHIGVPFSRALEKLSASSGAWEALHIRRIRNRLRRGEREGAALASDLFDDSLRWQIELYGRMTQFSSGLEQLSERSIEQTQASIRQSFGLIRILLMFAIAAMIAWVYMAFLAITMAAKTSV